MRKIYFCILIAVIGCKSVQQNTTKDEAKTMKSSNDKVSSKSFKEYKGDTLQYLNDFVANKQKYVGKSLDVLLNDLDLEVKSYTCHIPFRPNTHATSISLEFYDKDEISRKIYTQTPYQYLNIEFAPPFPTTDEVNKILVENKDQSWGKSHIDFFGKLVIKDFTAYTYSDPAKQAKH